MREYDAVIGRWTVPDPMRIHWSPYLAMGNNPVNSMDPTGGCETGDCPGDTFEFMGETYVYGEGGDFTIFGGSFADMSSQPVNTSGNGWETTKAATGIAIMTSAADGPIPVGEVVGAAIVSGALAYDMVQQSKDFKYVTYTKTSADGFVYVGRTSGYGTPTDIVKLRDYGHHMDVFGYGVATPSTWAPASVPGGYSTRLLDPSYWAIRGSEQLQIEGYRSQGISGNRVNGIGPNNPNIDKYIDAARNVLGF